MLTQHHKSQPVLCESLKLLEQLAPHYESGTEREGEGGREGGGGRVGPESPSVTLSHLGTILSAIW